MHMFVWSKVVMTTFLTSGIQYKILKTHGSIPMHLIVQSNSIMIFVTCVYRINSCVFSSTIVNEECRLCHGNLLQMLTIEEHKLKTRRKMT